ncbi:MAG: hypothetical protein HRT45_06230 [Bdellovibrionales bacterium]|nr:hypothetical protein [Bdellovibrionales bacterium]
MSVFYALLMAFSLQAHSWNGFHCDDERWEEYTEAYFDIRDVTQVCESSTRVELNLLKESDEAFASKVSELSHLVDDCGAGGAASKTLTDCMFRVRQIKSAEQCAAYNESLPEFKEQVGQCVAASEAGLLDWIDAHESATAIDKELVKWRLLASGCEEHRANYDSLNDQIRNCRFRVRQGL